MSHTTFIIEAALTIIRCIATAWINHGCLPAVAGIVAAAQMRLGRGVLGACAAIAHVGPARSCGCSGSTSSGEISLCGCCGRNLRAPATAELAGAPNASGLSLSAGCCGRLRAGCCGRLRAGCCGRTSASASASGSAAIACRLRKQGQGCYSGSGDGEVTTYSVSDPHRPIESR